MIVNKVVKFMCDYESRILDNPLTFVIEIRRLIDFCEVYSDKSFRIVRCMNCFSWFR